MENFNKSSLKSAVAKYGQLHIDGKAEDDVRAELAADERGFTAEQIDEIYAAIVGEEAPAAKKSYRVIEGKSFRDKDDFSVEFTEGSDISHLSQDRIDHLVSIGYVEEA